MTSYATSIARKKFANLSSSHIATLSGFVGGGSNAIATGVTPDAAAALEPFNTDWLRHAKGYSNLVLFPKSSSEVSEIMKFCNQEKIAVCPQGGNTGLVHGSVPVHDEVIISTSKMTGPMEVHADTYSMVCGAGCVLQTLQEAAKSKGFIFPLDLGAKGSCQIGGNISTNAGGIHYARYGSVRSNVLGLEAVTATGEIISSMTRGSHSSAEYRAARKDNVGYDLKQLFVGTEGTLGIVTKAEMCLYTRPVTNNIMLLHVKNFKAVLQLFHCCKRNIGDLMSAFEVMDSAGLTGGYASKLSKMGGAASDLFFVGDVDKSSALEPSFVVLLETQGFSEKHDEERLMEFLEALSSGEGPIGGSLAAAAGDNVFIDQVMATSEAQLRQIWNVREDLPVVLSSCGTIIKYDVCFPFDGFYLPVDFARRAVVKDILGLDFDFVMANPAGNGDAIARIEKLLGEELIVTGYGHFGDGNVHLNIVDRTADRRHSDYLKNKLSGVIYDHVIEKGGSVSAEHGVGMQKRKYLAKSRSPQWVGMMKDIKHMMDPNGILSPYKMFLE